MVDDIKKQMHRFESLIGFKGQLDITSKESVKSLIDVLQAKYKRDVHLRVRLHRLEFLYGLVERDIAAEARSLRPEHKDIDDWKDLMILSRIYYVLEHQRSEGIVLKGKAARKKNFSDKDLVEWQVTQNFRLRRLEDWFESRKDARSLAKKLQLDDLIGESFEKKNEDRKALTGLYRMFDSTSSDGEVSDEQATTRADKPFKFEDDSINDWTESYSEDSEYSDVGEFPEEFDFPDEAPRDMRPFEEPSESSEVLAEEEDTKDSVFKRPLPKFLPFREDIFKDMNETETHEEWFQLYNQSFVLPVEQPEEEEEESPPPDLLTTKMDTITEEDDENLTIGVDNIKVSSDTEENENINVLTNAGTNEHIEVPSDTEEDEDTGFPSDMSNNEDIEKPKNNGENEK